MEKNLIDISKYSKFLKIFSDKSVIFNEGEPGEEMYIIARGEVEITKRTDSGEKVLMTLKHGDIFGEMALVDNFPRSASAIAKGQTTLIYIDEKAFDEMVLNNPQFALRLIKILAHRLRNANMQIYDLVTKDRENQLLSGIIRFAKETGADKTFKGLRIDIAKTIIWVNKNLGFSSKVANYLLNELVKKNLLEKAMSSRFELIIPERTLQHFK